MPKYIVDYTINFAGNIEIEADSAEEAEMALFEMRSVDLALIGELDGNESREVVGIEEQDVQEG